MVKREYELQEPIAVAVDKYVTFIQSTPDHVVDFRTEDRDRRDVEFRRWLGPPEKGRTFSVGEVHQSASKCPQKHRAGWSSRNETFSRASRSWALCL
jgi:hypothetical protein